VVTSIKMENLLKEEIKRLILQANTVLRADVLEALKRAYGAETNANGKKVLSMLIENAAIAKDESKPICQDTGYVDIYFEWPDGLPLRADLQEIANEAVRQVYSEKNFRKSIVKSSIERENTEDNTPANTYILPAEDSELKVKVFVKGAGSDNSSSLFMLNPSSSKEDIKKVVVDIVKANAAKSCPPLVVGIGIGASFDKVASLSKRALFRRLGEANPSKPYAELEEEILAEINSLGIGPSGLGGDTTALSVAIEQAPCHMASLPVAINLNCHALRTAEKVISSGG
jgi:fumarate hydratase subunit alpha